MKKIIITIIILSSVIFTSILLYNNTKYVEFNNIEEHIESEVGYDVSIKKHLSKDCEYFMYTFEDKSREKHIGMSYYEKKFGGQYKRIGGSSTNQGFGTYNLGYHGEVFYRLYAVFGENKGHQIDNIKLDFQEVVYNENIANEDYYLIVYKFTEKDYGGAVLTFYDDKGNEIRMSDF
ncbi:MAG: hypothetical protein FH761_18025 [Firmicutes bacterium]|nr:hypothetical protein [Bacillota bacterium]